MQSPPSLAPVPACLATQHPERTKNYPMVIYRAGALPRPPALRLHSLGALTYLRAHIPRPVLTPPHKKLSVPVPTPWQLKSGPGLDFLDRWRRCFRPHRLRRHHGQVCAPTGAGRRAAAQAGGILRLKSAWRLCLLWCLCRPVPCRAPAGWAPLAAKWSSGVGVRFPVAGVADLGERPLRGVLRAQSRRSCGGEHPSTGWDSPSNGPRFRRHITTASKCHTAVWIYVSHQGLNWPNLAIYANCDCPPNGPDG